MGVRRQAEIPEFVLSLVNAPGQNFFEIDDDEIDRDVLFPTARFAGTKAGKLHFTLIHYKIRPIREV